VKSTHKIAGVIILFLIISVALLSVMNVASTVMTNDEDWSDYQPISDPNLNSTYFKMVVDSHENTHIFWNSRDEINNQSTIVHEVIFSNYSVNVETIVTLNEVSSSINFDVDIDKLNRIHLIYYNDTHNQYYYLIGDQNYWFFEGTFIEIQTSFTLVVDNDYKLHFIYFDYSLRTVFDKILEVPMAWTSHVIWSYSVNSETEFISAFRFRKAKSLEGKIAIMFTYDAKDFGEGGLDINELHCFEYIFGWSSQITIANYYAQYYDLEYDDIEKLHFIYKNLDDPTVVNYQTMRRNKLSKIQQVTLFTKDETTYGYKSLASVNLEIQGITRLIAVTKYEFLPTGMDYDLGLTYSNDGTSWTHIPVYSGNETKSTNPIIESTKSGDVFIASYEQPIGENCNSTIYLAKNFGFFTYQTTKASLTYMFLIIFGAVTIIITKRKTRKQFY
jgi:hypothetical protein